MQPEHSDFIDRLIQAWNSHDPTQAAALYAAQFEGTDISQVVPLRGAGDMHDYFARFYAAFPDVQVMVDTVVANGEHYAVAWTAQGTHQGKLMNIPPTGKPVCVRGMTLLTTVAGKVQNSSTVWDMAGLLRAIGLLPRLTR
jgi:steroid delta-isomerase-like uncharacterized protein